MGFSKNQSENSIKQYHTIDAALEAKLSFANNNCMLFLFYKPILVKFYLFLFF
jgi:hypothetical protein